MTGPWSRTHNVRDLADWAVLRSSWIGGIGACVCYLMKSRPVVFLMFLPVKRMIRHMYIIPHKTEHTHTCICGLWGAMAFILYKLYFLSLYPKPTPHRKLLAIFTFWKTQFSMFLIHLLYGPHEPCLLCNTHVILHICVLVNHIFKNTQSNGNLEKKKKFLVSDWYNFFAHIPTTLNYIILYYIYIYIYIYSHYIYGHTTVQKFGLGNIFSYIFLNKSHMLTIKSLI